jgi:hypothetical protein
MTKQTRRQIKPSGRKEKEMAKNDNRTILESFDPQKLVQETKKIAAWSIDTSENLAKEAIKFQEQMTSWAKDTPLEKVFETQKAIAERLVETSAQFARTFWQVEKPEEQQI